MANRSLTRGEGHRYHGYDVRLRRSVMSNAVMAVEPACFDGLYSASCRQAPRFETASGPRRLHLACGDHGKTGWINVDLFGPGADLRLDLREPLPFSSNTI